MSPKFHQISWDIRPLLCPRMRTPELLDFEIRHIAIDFESMTSPEIREREMAPLKKIPDNSERAGISMNTGL